jgi:hypothetical protein
MVTIVEVEFMRFVFLTLLSSMEKVSVKQRFSPWALPNGNAISGKALPLGSVIGRGFCPQTGIAAPLTVA